MDIKIENFKKTPYEYIINLSLDELIEIINYTSNSYYNLGISIISDELYDLLINEVKKRDNNHPILKKVGYEITENKIKLPYWMGSQTKIKENEKELLKWKTKYKSTNYVISDKLDGISGLYLKNRLYTRGDGEYGRDISNILKYININKNIKEEDVVRGELIISKENFKKLKKYGKNARNLVSGQILSKKLNKNILKYIDFVAYELIVPRKIPSEQLNYLKDNNYLVSENITISDFNKEYLTNYLENRRLNGEYEIDGIIITQNKLQEIITEGNPKYSFAYKIIHSDQIGYVKVIKVNWNLSKDGYFKPQIQIKPIELCGVTIEYLTGFNAKYIVDNKIGKDSELKIIRSGDVIPHILEIIEESENIELPQENYIWTDSGVDIIAVNLDDNNNINIKKITHFFKTLGVKDMSDKIITKLYINNLNDINKILTVSINDLEKIDGIQNKMATKLYNNIQKSISNIDLVTLMVASNLLGRGFGKKKISLIIKKYPDILNWSNSNDYIINKICEIDGFNNKTTSLFVNNIQKFNIFLNNLPDNIKIKNNDDNIKSNLFNNKSFVLTGFRSINDINIEEFIINNGGNVKSTITKNIDYLVTKDKNSSSSKIIKAKKLEIKIIDTNEFKSMFLD